MQYITQTPLRVNSSVAQTNNLCYFFPFIPSTCPVKCVCFYYPCPMKCAFYYLPREFRFFISRGFMGCHVKFAFFYVISLDFTGSPIIYAFKSFMHPPCTHSFFWRSHPFVTIIPFFLLSVLPPPPSFSLLHTYYYLPLPTTY